MRSPVVQLLTARRFAPLFVGVLFANEQVVTLMLALFAIGVGGGSLLAERLLHGDLSARHVPLGGCVMAACAVDLSVGSAGHPPTTELANVATFSHRAR
jgi:acyl-[acyl-carrier-protein]-phospholipid O-acyltransferase/long-chain-fatty-acid--[acyl-carrier-protein] ligase